MSGKFIKNIFLLFLFIFFISVIFFLWPTYGYGSYLYTRKFVSSFPGISSVRFSADCKHWLGESSTYFDFLKVSSNGKNKTSPHIFIEGIVNGEPYYLMGSTNLPYDIAGRSNFLIYDNNQFLYFDQNKASIIKINKNKPDLDGKNFASRLALLGMNQEVSYNLSTSTSGKISLIVLKQKEAFGCSPDQECLFMGKDKKENPKKYWDAFKKDDIVTEIHTMCTRLAAPDVRYMVNDYRLAKATCDTPEQIEKISINYNNALENCAAFDRDIIPLLDKFYIGG